MVEYRDEDLEADEDKHTYVLVHQPTVYSCNPDCHHFWWFSTKKVSFMCDFKRLYLKKYSSYEDIINMKNVQNDPNFVKK